jgi:acyl-CoA thioesterase I
MTSLKDLVILMLVCSCLPIWRAQAETANPATQNRPRIVILGDSITAGYGLERSQAYPALLQKKISNAGLAYEVVNAGVSGDTTSGGLRRLDWALGSGAEVLIVALGGNDGLRGLAPKQTEANLIEIISRARAKIPGLTVIVAGMQMPANFGPEFVEAFNGLFARIATQQKAELIPFLLDGIAAQKAFNQPDMIHPNPEGQKQVAETLWKTLQKVLQPKLAEK